MFDIKRIQNHYEEIRNQLKDRNCDQALLTLKVLDDKRRELIAKIEGIKQKKIKSQKKSLSLSYQIVISKK